MQLAGLIPAMTVAGPTAHLVLGPLTVRLRDLFSARIRSLA